MCTQSHVISIFDSWLPQIERVSSTGTNLEMHLPACDIPLPSLVAHTSQSVPSTSFIPVSETSSSPMRSHQDPTLSHENGAASTTTQPVTITQYVLDQSSATELELTPSQSSHSSKVPLPRTMVTRSQAEIVKPNPKYALSSIKSVDIPREPRNFRSVLGIYVH